MRRAAQVVVLLGVSGVFAAWCWLTFRPIMRFFETLSPWVFVVLLLGLFYGSVAAAVYSSMGTGDLLVEVSKDWWWRDRGEIKSAPFRIFRYGTSGYLALLLLIAAGSVNGMGALIGIIIGLLLITIGLTVFPRSREPEAKIIAGL